jgi:hypothetical protein
MHKPKPTRSIDEHPTQAPHASLPKKSREQLRSELARLIGKLVARDWLRQQQAQTSLKEPGSHGAEQA